MGRQNFGWPFSSDVLVLDDGNDTADGIIGEGPNSAFSFYWLNQFDLAQDFQLEAIQVRMNTDVQNSNMVEVAVIDGGFNDIARGGVDLGLAPNGGWFTITLTNPVGFSAGDKFYLEFGANHAIPYPAGADKDAQVPNRSYHYNWGTAQYEAIGAVAGFENGAYLIRAVGTKTGGGTNQPPVARMQLSKSQASVNEPIIFDASQSADPDGQIVQYAWDFGDGSTSNEKVATHVYSRAGNFVPKLTVTDNQGATGKAVGFVTISGGGTNHLTVNPANGTIAPGSTQTITVTFDANGLAEGIYQGQIDISSNGGNKTLPVRVTVSNASTRTVELIYDSGITTEDYCWNKVGQGSAVRFTPPSLPAKVKEAKIMIASIQNGDKHKLRVLADANGRPGNTIYGPVEFTLPNAGWLTYNLSAANLTVNGDFYVMIEYDGVNKPSFGSENAPPLEKRSWDFDGTNWSLFDSEDYLIRAVVEISTSSVDDRNEGDTVPQAFELAQNYPNPFNPETTIKYQLPEQAQVELAVYDLTGRRVITLESGMKTTGVHEARWNGRDQAGRAVASGVYFYRMHATSRHGQRWVMTKKMTVMR